MRLYECPYTVRAPLGVVEELISVRVLDGPVAGTLKRSRMSVIMEFKLHESK